MKKNNKRLVIILSIILLGVYGCTNSNNLESISLMLDYTPNTNHTGLYVAIDKGYYEDEGLNLDIITTGESSVVQSVANGVVDFGISYQEDVTMAHYQGISNIKSIYGILKENTSGFMSFKDKNITTPQDFKGKTYCGWGSDVEKALVLKTASLGEVNEDDISYAVSDTDFLRSDPNTCDIFWEFQGWAGIQADLEGIEYNYIPLKDLGIDFYSPIIITNQELINNNQELVQSFINATIKGYTYAAQNPSEAGDIFLKYNPSYDKELITNSQNFLSSYYIADNEEAGYQLDKTWQDFTQFLNDSKIISTNNYEGLYTNEFINEYYKS